MKRTLLFLVVIALGLGISSRWWFSDEPVVEKLETPPPMAVESTEKPAERPLAAAPIVAKKPAETGERKQRAGDRFKSVYDLLNDKRPELALDVLKEMLAKNPNDDVAWLEMALIQANFLNQPEQAVAALQKALQANPNNDEAMAELLGLGGQNGATMAGVKAVYDRNPENANVGAGLGRMYADRGDYANAIPLLEKSSQDDRFKQSALYSLLESYEATGQTAQSISTYERLIEYQQAYLQHLKQKGFDPKGMEGDIASNQMGLAAAMISNRNYDGAERLLQQLRERNPNQEGLAGLYQRLQKERSG